MKNIAKFLVISFITLSFYQSNAQVYTIKSGLNLAKMLYIIDDFNYGSVYSNNPGMHMGLSIDLPSDQFLTYEPGLFISSKGYILEYKMNEVIIEELNLYYLDIPINLKASYDILKSGIKVIGTFGPYFGFGLSGNFIKKAGKKEVENYKIEWGNNQYKDQFKRFEIGYTTGLGLEIKSLMVGISYDHGLTNILVNQESGDKRKNRVLKLSLGYIFLNRQ